MKSSPIKVRKKKDRKLTTGAGSEFSRWIRVIDWLVPLLLLLIEGACPLAERVIGVKIIQPLSRILKF